MFHFYTLVCKITTVPRNLPNAWIVADRLVTSGGPAAGKEERASGAQFNHDGRPTQASTTATVVRLPLGSGAGSNLGHVVSFNARECLKEVGPEIGVPQ